MISWRSMKGIIMVEVTSADIMSFILKMNQFDVSMDQITAIDALTVQMQIPRTQYSLLRRIAKRYGAQIRIKEYIGVYWTWKRVIKRPVLVVGVVLMFLLSLYLPTRVLFLRVSGNRDIPAKLILEKASTCGIHLGASRRDVRSEQVKNALLEELPELQWLGVNTNGCVATIFVKEKDLEQTLDPKQNTINSIVARYDGVITEAAITRGNPLCRVGQAVKAGQKLVSGYVDCGLRICATGAEAEIFALTQRHITVSVPYIRQKRGKLLSVDQNCWYQFGKKLYNFNNNSSILDATCVKIYDKVSVRLPGGFRLPVYRIIETCYYYEFTDHSQQSLGDNPWVEQFAQDYLSGQMIAGEILKADLQIQHGVDVVEYSIDYTCKEMIAISQAEEIIK